ncbi:MAG: NAD(P)-dependent alcohol dehydrogenase [Candidatus Lokiarchaeota archaeon]|nr:NAD(P)-dependent alcohol dehydrogenase [Candidatus Lokiarchaeota archaeon]
MKAIIYEEFGSPDVLVIKEVEKPVPKDNELLVKVYATSVNALDIIFRTGEKKLFGFTKLMTGFKKPKTNILGFDVSGEVESVGKKVTKFKMGDLVYGAKGPKPGANAEYCCISEEHVAIKPSNMSHEEAAAVPDTACTALTGLKEKVNIQEGQSVLIYGASGGVGTYAIQIARLFTADVTAVCSTDKISNAQALGAKTVIDYTEEDFTQNGQKYDYIFDAVGRRKISYSMCKNSLSENGIFVTVDLETVLFKQIRNKHIKSYLGNVSTGNLEFLKEQIEAGKIKSIVEKVFPFEQLADAHRYYEKGHLKGKVVVTFQV